MLGRILVIDDNAMNMELMVYLLAAAGFTTLQATDGDEGLRMAHEERPDLILCDLQMPRLSGYELAAQAKESAALGDIPLVAITALAMVGDREKALAAGFDGYLSKPIEPESFARQIEAFLPARLRPGPAT